MAGLDEDSASKFIRKLGALGHASPIEHASFTFAIDGISRACLAQITRHRIASYSVQSQRYVDMTDFHYVIPPEIDCDDTARAEFIYAMNECARSYLILKRRLTAEHTQELVEKYHMSEELAVKKAEKIANEDARFALPNACATNMVMTMNARSLLNFFNLRCCMRAQWEIRELAIQMYRLVYNVAPAVFEMAGPSCVATGKCSEGSMSCGQKDYVVEMFNQIKQEDGQ